MRALTEKTSLWVRISQGKGVVETVADDTSALLAIRLPYQRMLRPPFDPSLRSGHLLL
jgi:hypothetical protein